MYIYFINIFIGSKKYVQMVKRTARIDCLHCFLYFLENIEVKESTVN